MTATPDRDRDLLIKVIESLAEQKAMLRTALERQDKTDGQIEVLRGRLDTLEKTESHRLGRAGVLSTIFGAGAGGAVTLLVALFRDRLGF